MTSKTQIAVLVAALFLGAQAGIAALEQDPSIVSAESAEPAQEQLAEVTEPATTAAPEATAAVEPAAAAIQVPAVARASDVYPRSPDGRDMLPALAAYLEQRDAVLSKLVARGDAFPRSADVTAMLPATIAYLERRESTLVARTRSQQPETAAPAAEGTQPTTSVTLGLYQQAVGTSN